LSGSTRYLVIVTARQAPAGTTDVGFVNFTIDGTAQADTSALIIQAGSATSALVQVQASTVTVVTGLTTASHTFALTYKVAAAGDSVTSSNRSITVIPLN
jgi:hypothetical protein